VGLTESNVETVSDDAKEETAVSESDHQGEGEGQFNADPVIATLIFMSVGIVAASLGRASLWRLSRFNTPRLRNIIFGSKLDAVTWVLPIGYVTIMIYGTGSIVYFNCVEKVTNCDGTVTWKYAFNSKNLFESCCRALWISLLGCLITTPEITMGSVLGGRLIQRRMLINARKLQQQMTTASHSRPTI